MTDAGWVSAHGGNKATRYVLMDEGGWFVHRWCVESGTRRLGYECLDDAYLFTSAESARGFAEAHAETLRVMRVSLDLEGPADDRR